MLIISLYEAFIVSCFVSIFMSIFWKWSKTLLIIILMESLTALILSIFFTFYSSYSVVIILMFVFSVSETLILLSSLYGSLRSSGSINSGLLL